MEIDAQKDRERLPGTLVRVFLCLCVFLVFTITKANAQGPVARSLVSANCWVRRIKIYRFPW